MLNDMHSFKDKMRGVEQIMKELEIERGIGKTRCEDSPLRWKEIADDNRPEQLNLPEDPAFMPDLDMGFDLSVFDIPSDSSRAPSILSSQTMASSRSSVELAQEGEELGHALPSVDASGDLDGLDINFGGGTSSAEKKAYKAGMGDIFEESPIIENPEFEIAEDGSIITLPTPEEQAAQSEARSAIGDVRGASELAIIGRFTAESEAVMADDEVSVEATLWESTDTISSISTLITSPSFSETTISLSRLHNPSHRNQILKMRKLKPNRCSGNLLRKSPKAQLPQMPPKHPSSALS
jgi:hypothetical protein